MSQFLRAAGALVSATLAVALTLAAWPSPGGGARPSDGPPGSGRVVRVVDGDTVVVALAAGGAGGPVRLIGIDTPETVAPNRPVECYGPEASARLKHLLPPGTAVRLWRDVEPRDRYGRLLAYVQRRRDALFVNADQVTAGAAIAKAFPPNTAFRADLEAAEAGARAGGRGLWGQCGGADVPLRQ